jgi:UTP--glucose-1-phosphate uridylyltransferase
MKNTKIRTAILPVAGMGTRFLPATKAQPKEMLPIVDTPIIQFLVEEAVKSGIERIIFVTGKGKRAIEDHFDNAFELEHSLTRKGKHDMVDELRGISNMAHFAFVRQKEPRGDGDAILSAAHLIGDEPVAILFGDDIILSEKPCLAQMMRVFEKYGEPVEALEKVATSAVSSYGIFEGKKCEDRVYKATRILEKPKPTETKSRLGVVGKYIITPEIFDRLREIKPGKDGEVRLADALQAHLAAGKSVYGLEFDGLRFDCGSKLGFLEATVEYGLRHAETKKDFAAYLKKRVNK